MNRRRFVAASVAALAAPRAAGAQQPGKVYRRAILGSALPIGEMAETRDKNLKAFFEELRRLGYREGQNLTVERRSAEGDARRFPELAREIVKLKPGCNLHNQQSRGGCPQGCGRDDSDCRASLRSRRSGLAVSLARPGGNVTGVTSEPGLEILGKSISILKEVAPSASRIAFLTARLFWEDRYRAAWREAAQLQDLTSVVAAYEYPADEAEFRRVFAALVRNRVELLGVGATRENFRHRHLIVKLAAEAKLPAIYWIREHVDAGGLMAYAIDLVALFRRAAGYVDQILKGANPAELPIQQPSRFELAINLKAAKAIGLTIPPSLLARADEVIE